MNIRSLNDQEKSALADGMSLASRMAAHKLPLPDHIIQELYDHMLATDDDFPEGIIAIGIVFGELIAKKGGVEWVRISDEYGEETCLAIVGKQLVCSPISMIQKRIEMQEHVDIAVLASETKIMLERKSKDTQDR